MSHPAFTPQPQSITAIWPVLISRSTEGRRLSWLGWLVTYRGCVSARRRPFIPVPTDRWCSGRGSNSRPLSRNSDALTTRLPNHLLTYLLIYLLTCYLQVLGERLVQLFNSLTFFMLAGNPLHCNCELRWFRRWLASDAQSLAKVLDSGDVRCVSPSTLTGLLRIVLASTATFPK